MVHHGNYLDDDFCKRLHLENRLVLQRAAIHSVREKDIDVMDVLAVPLKLFWTGVLT